MRVLQNKKETATAKQSVRSVSSRSRSASRPAAKKNADRRRVSVAAKDRRVPTVVVQSVRKEERAAYPVSYLASELDKRFEKMMARVEKGHLPTAEQLNQLWSGWKITRGLLLTKEQDIKRQHELTETDAKTGLVNRTGLYRMLLALDSRVISRAHVARTAAQEHRHSRQEKAVHAVRMDLTGIKEVADRYHHHAADVYVSHVGMAIGRACQRSSDIVARVDKHAFVVLGFNMTNDGAETLARKVLAAVRSAIDEAKAELAASGTVPEKAATAVAAIVAHTALNECAAERKNKKETIIQLVDRIDAVMRLLRTTRPDRIVPAKEFAAVKCGKVGADKE